MFRLFSVVAGFLIIFTPGIALAQGEEEVLQAILEQALKREEVFQLYEAEVGAGWYREGEEEPYHEEATYLVRDAQKYFYSESEGRYVWAYDGKCGKVIHPWPEKHKRQRMDRRSRTSLKARPLKP